MPVRDKADISRESCAYLASPYTALQVLAGLGNKTCPDIQGARLQEGYIFIILGYPKYPNIYYPIYPTFYLIYSIYYTQK